MKPTSENFSHSPARAPSGPIVLEVRGLGPVPAFKNSKLLTRGKIITKPEYKQWMERCVQAFAFQLFSAIRACDAGTSTEQPALCLIVSLLPEDDCWTILPELHVRAERCPKGEEGATITIERI
jgi:hypothetical protein